MATCFRPEPLRFWEKVDKNGPIPHSRPELGPCWLWTAGRRKGGYGSFRLGPDRGNRSLPATRWALEQALGRPVAEGLLACHHCDNPPCVNPSHLFEGSNAQNQADMQNKGRARKAVGERAGPSKLTAEQVLEIRARVRAGESHAAVARAFGVNQSSVTLIHQRKNWKHLPEVAA